MIILLIVLFMISTNVYGYELPIGIPSPVSYFEGFDPINTPAPTVNNDGTSDYCINWPLSETAGCYFIDNTDPNATDSDNPYGYPSKPRKTPPEGQLSPGSLVYFNGGIYTSVDSQGDRFDWSGNGTAQNPIWIIGNPSNKPEIQDYIHIGNTFSAKYLILDHLIIRGASYVRIDIRASVEGVNINHIVIRNCILEGTNSTSDYSAITIGNTSDIINDTSYNYFVIYNNQIQYFGDKATTEQCGVYLGFPTDYTWVLNNIIHDVGADAVAGSHRSNYVDKFARHYFIGGNTLYQTGENAIDLKAIDNYIISQNNMYGPFFRENGAAMILHYGSESVGCRNGWVIFNKIHDCVGGVLYTYNIESIYIIGNLIYNIYDNPEVPDPLNGVGVGFRGSSGTMMIVNNTIYNYERAGIRCNQTLDASNLIIENNIITERTSNDGFEIWMDDGETNATVRYNQYYNSNNDVLFYWNDSARNLAYMKSIGQCIEGQEGDPLLSNNDWSLTRSSPCKDRGIVSQAYDDFYLSYNIDIKKDIRGRTRPYNNKWDIGAYEYVLLGRIKTGTGLFKNSGSSIIELR